VTTVVRYHGWTMEPPMAPGTPTAPVMLALGDGHLTQWIGDPAVVWQTPLAQVHDLALHMSRTLRLAATINDVRYVWTAPRGPDHDEFADTVRAAGGRVMSAARARAFGVGALVVVVLLASVASIALLVDNTVSPPPSATAVGTVNVQRTDLPAGWAADASGDLTVLVGAANDQVTNSTTAPALTGTADTIWVTASASFQRCVGVAAGADRMFGPAGQEPRLQVSGTVYATSANGAAEVGSLVQDYGESTMVRADLAEYDRPAFGRCWGQVSAQLLAASLTGTVASVKQDYLTTAYAPATFTPGFRAGGLTTLSVPGYFTNDTLVSLFAASGHYEVNFYALTGNWPKSKAVVLAAFAAMLARLNATGLSKPATYALGSLRRSDRWLSGTSAASLVSAR
jgi:hypothetical protein